MLADTSPPREAQRLSSAEARLLRSLIARALGGIPDTAHVFVGVRCQPEDEAAFRRLIGAAPTLTTQHTDAEGNPTFESEFVQTGTLHTCLQVSWNKPGKDEQP